MSSTTDSSPTPTNPMSEIPTLTVVAGPSGNDDDDDSGYLPVIIAASCACVLLLLIAIVLIVIIIRVKRRGKDSSNLSSPSGSKINNYDDLGDVKYFPISESQSNIQKTQSSSEIQNQEDLQRNKTPEYDLPVFTSIEKTPVVASYNLLDASDTAYDTPDDALNPKSESSSPPTDPLYDPVSMEEHILKSDNGPKSPVEEYDKLVHSPTPQGAANLPPSIYDTLDEESLRNHYEFPDKDDDNGGLQSTTPLRLSTTDGYEYTIPQTL
ncbi:uncharacterized protein [Dysidea avara]|uniref:uncharacterized protein n=1 Tax=Dysidea avara TaxID=196820 RepID=UPI0033277A24